MIWHCYTSGRVDCGGGWNLARHVYRTRRLAGKPVVVEGGRGREVVGVIGLTSDLDGTYCALLTSGGLDCWGYGAYGQIGNGTFYTSSPYGSATPWSSRECAGTGTLTGVSSLVSDGSGGLAGDGFCGLLTTGETDCWGYGIYGELGNGTFSDSATPALVEGVGLIGTLSGVTDITSNGDGSYCS